MELKNSVTPRIKESEHVFICGTTGCGKSVLAEVFLAGYQNVIKLDTKGEVHERRSDGKSIWYGLTENEDFVVCEHISEVKNSDFGKIIYAPVWDENEPDFYNELFQYVFERGDTIVWVDELMTVTTGQVIPRYLKAIYTAGRSRKAVAWSLSQRPMDIPSICIANSQHFFVFTMPQPQDRKKMVDITGCPDLMIKPDKYVFWYFKEGMDEDEAKQAYLDFND